MNAPIQACKIRPGETIKEFLSVSEGSEYLSLKPSTLYALVEQKSIPHYRVGRLIRFKKTEIDLWMQGKKSDCIDIDPKKVAGKILRKVKNPPRDVGKMVKKAIDEAKGFDYTSSHGKPDQVKGLGKEVSNGSV